VYARTEKVYVKRYFVDFVVRLNSYNTSSSSLYVQRCTRVKRYKYTRACISFVLKDWPPFEGHHHIRVRNRNNKNVYFRIRVIENITTVVHRKRNWLFELTCTECFASFDSMNAIRNAGTAVFGENCEKEEPTVSRLIRKTERFVSNPG